MQLERLANRRGNPCNESCQLCIHLADNEPRAMHFKPREFKAPQSACRTYNMQALGGGSEQADVALICAAHWGLLT